MEIRTWWDAWSRRKGYVYSVLPSRLPYIERDEEPAESWQLCAQNLADAGLQLLAAGRADLAHEAAIAAVVAGERAVARRSFGCSYGDARGTVALAEAEAALAATPNRHRAVQLEVYVSKGLASAWRAVHVGRWLIDGERDWPSWGEGVAAWRRYVEIRGHLDKDDVRQLLRWLTERCDYRGCLAAAAEFTKLKLEPDPATAGTTPDQALCALSRWQLGEAAWEAPARRGLNRWSRRARDWRVHADTALGWWERISWVYLAQQVDGGSVALAGLVESVAGPNRPPDAGVPQPRWSGCPDS